MQASYHIDCLHFRLLMMCLCVFNLNHSCVPTLYRRRSRTIRDPGVAGEILGQFGRCILSRRRTVRRAGQLYRRVWDADTSSYYYAQIQTGETSWYKNTHVFLSSEPPVYRDHEQQNSSDPTVGAGGAGESVKRRRSPRVNRA